MGLYGLINSVIGAVIVLKTLQPSTTYYNVTLSRDGSGQGDEKGFLQKMAENYVSMGDALYGCRGNGVRLIDFLQRKF